MDLFINDLANLVASGAALYNEGHLFPRRRCRKAACLLREGKSVMRAEMHNYIYNSSRNDLRLGSWKSELHISFMNRERNYIYNE